MDSKLLSRVVLVAAALAGGDAAFADTVRVTAPEAAIYLNANEKSPVLATVKQGTVLDVRSRERDWYGVLLPPDEQGLRRFGFIASSLVELIEETPSAESPRPAPDALPADALPPFARPAHAKQGVYVGFRYSRHQPRGGGDFDGLHFIRSASELFVVPRRQQTGGPDITLGYRYERGAIELSYVYAPHRGDWAGTPFDAAYHGLDVDGRVYLASRAPVQPYLLGGIGLSWLHVQDGVIPFATSGAAGDATLTGVGFNAGAGVTVYPHPRIGVSGGGAYRLDFYTRAKGGSTDWSDIDEAFFGRGLRISGGVTFTF